MLGEHLDLSSEPERIKDAAAASRKYVGVHFACCDLYSRVYVNRDETAYTGYCPRCSRRITLKIGPGGTDARFFTVY